MYFTTLRRLFYLFAAVLVIGQIIGLVFCGEADCLQGSSDENCAALFCGLLAKHEAPGSKPDNEQNSFCQCACHLLIDEPKTTFTVRLLISAPHNTSEALKVFNEPIHDIDRPPIA